MVEIFEGSGAGATEPGARAGEVKMVRPMWAPERHWRWAWDCTAYLSIDLTKPQCVRLYNIEDVSGSGDGFVFRARKFRRATQVIWDGANAQVHDEFPWEKESEKPVEHESCEGASEGGDDDLSDVASATRGKCGNRDKGDGAPEPVATGSTPKPDPTDKAHDHNGCRRRTSGSAQAWARPLVPGHPATNTMLPDEIRECVFNRIARKATGETSWVARFWGEEGILN
jgi:hypothetical protein